MSVEERLARSAPTLDAAIESHVGRGRRRPEHRWVAVAAAVVLVVGGVVGVAALRDRAGSGPTPGVSSPVSTDGEALPMPTLPDRESGPALTTPVPSDVQAMVVPSLPGWRVESTSGFLPIAAVPSSGCPGCGADRLVLVGEGGIGGPLFTAWSVDVEVAIGDFDHAVTVGGVEGRATSSPVGTPSSETRVTVAWPLGDGPGALTAIVDTQGIAEDQVLEWAALLSWQNRVPTFSVRPAGFTVVDAPAAPPVEVGTSFTNGPSVIEFYAVNTGLHGLADWRSFGPLIGWTTEPRVVDGVDVALDPPEPADERPIRAITAMWVSGGWGYVAVGHIFDSEAEFLDTVRSLRLTDPETYAVATADAVEYSLPKWATTTGWNATASNSELPSAGSPGQ